MNPLTFAVILGSTRPGRKGEAVASWVVERARGRNAAYELVDLRDHPLPHYDERYPASRGQYELASTQEWAATVAPYDGYVFVTPEYNHSLSSVLKNALDTVFAEWNDKAAALVSYGSMGGVRAAEHLRQVLGALQVADIRKQLSFTLATDWNAAGAFAPAERHLKIAEGMFDQLEAWAAALKDLREPTDG
jgi:NAD(P)H-dependent FMN reductase